MIEQFDEFERLYRAVYPPDIMPKFWKENGELSSAVFKDKNGLSVERDGGRDEDVVVDDMRIYFYGYIISVLYRDCDVCNAVVKLGILKKRKDGEITILLLFLEMKHIICDLLI